MLVIESGTVPFSVIGTAPINAADTTYTSVAGSVPAICLMLRPHWCQLH